MGGLSENGQQRAHSNRLAAPMTSFFSMATTQAIQQSTTINERTDGQWRPRASGRRRADDEWIRPEGCPGWWTGWRQVPSSSTGRAESRLATDDKPLNERRLADNSLRDRCTPLLFCCSFSPFLVDFSGPGNWECESFETELTFEKARVWARKLRWRWVILIAMRGCYSPDRQPPITLPRNTARLNGRYPWTEPDWKFFFFFDQVQLVGDEPNRIKSRISRKSSSARVMNYQQLILNEKDPKSKKKQ